MWRKTWNRMSPSKLVRIGTIFRLREIGWERHKEYDEKSLKKLMAFQALMILPITMMTLRQPSPE